MNSRKGVFYSFFVFFLLGNLDAVVSQPDVERYFNTHPTFATNFHGQVTVENITYLVNTYESEFKNGYEALREVRLIEFQMVYALASRNQTPFFSYDQARLEIGRLIDKESFLEHDSSFELKTILKKLERLDIDGELGIQYYEALQRWKSVYFHAQKVMINDQKALSTIDFSNSQSFTTMLEVMGGKRALKDLQKPLAIFIAGSSGVGKSTIAEGLSRTIGISAQFVDHYREVLRGCVPKEVSPALHRSSFAPALNDNFIPAFYEHAAVVTHAVCDALKRQIAEGKSVVWEGTTLLPQLIPSEYFEKANILYIVIDVDGETEEERRQNHILRYVDGRARETSDSSRSPSRYIEKIDQIRTIQKEYRDIVHKNGYNLFINSQLPAVVSRISKLIKDPYIDSPPLFSSEIGYAEQKVALRRELKHSTTFGLAIQFVHDDVPSIFITPTLLPKGFETHPDWMQVKEKIETLGERIVWRVEE